MARRGWQVAGVSFALCEWVTIPNLQAWRSQAMPPDRKTQATQKTTSRSAAEGSLSSLTSLPTGQPPTGFTPPHGGYQDLLSYQKAEIVYDATVRFCDRFFNNGRER